MTEDRERGPTPAEETESSTNATAALADAAVAAEAARLLRSTLFLGVVALGLLFLLKDPWRLFGLGAVALKAGADLARYVATVRAARFVREHEDEPAD